jgi:hypothetical protein
MRPKIWCHGNHISPPPTTHHRPTREAAARLACSPAPACIGLSVRASPSSSPDRVVSVAGVCTAVLHDGGGLPATMTRRRWRAVVRHLTRSRAEAGETSSGEGSVLGVSSGVLAGNGDPRRAQLQVLLQLVLLALFPAPPLPRLVPPMTRSSLLGFPGAQGLASWRHWIEFAHEHACSFLSVYTRCKYSVTVYAVEDLPMSVHTILSLQYY